MSPGVRESLVRVGPFVGGLLVLAVLAAVRPIARERMAWKAVPARVLVRWLLLWAGWVVLTELVTRALHVPDPPRFAVGGAALGIRLVGVVVLAPLLEELAFRGVLFTLLLPRLGAVPTLLLTAAIFTAGHTQYGVLDLTQVFLDGVLFGLARLRTGSTRVPFWMHALGNAVSALQRLRPG